MNVYILKIDTLLILRRKFNCHGSIMTKRRKENGSIHNLISTVLANKSDQQAFFMGNDSENELV